MTSAHALPDTCPNCSRSVSGPYCSHCGQKVIVETPTLWEFIHEYLHHYIALDGTLTRTLKLLVAKPGKLTTEYLAGRRASYIKPLQLYLTISFIYFVASHLFSDDEAAKKLINPEKPQAAQTQALTKASLDDDTQRKVQDAIANAEEKRRAASKKRQNGTDIKNDVDVDINVNDWFARHPALRPLYERVKKRDEEFKTNNAEANRAMSERLAHYTPYAIFGLMPIAAFLLWLLYRKRGQRYGAHLVFALHLHAFVFLMLLIGLLPIDFGIWIPLAIYVYLIMAMRNAYGGRWVPQILRSFVLLAGYSIFGLLATVITWSAAFLA